MAQPTWYEEYFPMTTSIARGLSNYGNKVQNAFLASGINGNQGNRKTGLQSYTANTPARNVNIQAPRVPVSKVKPIMQQPVSTPSAQPTGLQRVSTPSSSSGPTQANLPPLVVPAAATATMANQLDSAVPVSTNVLPTAVQGELINPATGLTSLGVSGAYTDALGNTANAPTSGFNLGDLNWNDLAGIGQGAAALWGAYNDYEKNKMAKEAFGLQKDEYKRAVRKDKDFATNINKSGLGTYSAGV